MQVLGAELGQTPAAAAAAAGAVAPRRTLVLLDDDGRVRAVERAATIPEVATAAVRLAEAEPFLLGVDVAVVVPPKPARARPVERLVRRRLGHRLPPGGRGAAGDRALPGEALLAALAAAGQPCLPYPDRDRRRVGLAEIHPSLVLRSLAWQASALVEAGEAAVREQWLRAYAPPAYRAAALPARAGWAQQSAAIEQAVRLAGSPEGYDLASVVARLGEASSAEAVEEAASLLDAVLIAGTAWRYLRTPESCAFVGDREGGYVILPAEGFLRRTALRESSRLAGRLFPKASLRERLGPHAHLHSADLLEVSGQPQRLEARFDETPRYEFDNLDELLWWKHCRHVAGPALPTDGLREMAVVLASPGGGEGGPAGGANGGARLKLVRSRHRTLSFRFEPPAAWRQHVPTRDGKTYPFAVKRAVYEALAAD